MNISTLLDLQKLTQSFPPSLATFTIDKDGNPVTNHTFYIHWLCFLLPRVKITDMPREDVAPKATLFTPLGRLIALQGNLIDTEEVS